MKTIDKVIKSPTKIKRSKTFTGCFTCRSRKIRCDLQKPECLNCSKKGLKCAGYDIKLRWSEPMTFKLSKSGNATSRQVQFNKREDSDFFHRRQVEFVDWSKVNNFKPYETYDEMDKDLGILHNSGNDDKVNELGNTKLLGPFGVFQGNYEKSGNESMEVDPAPIFDAPHDHLWLSKELRDDALLTAAALNGDDFLQDNLLFNQELMNLLFHRNGSLNIDRDIDKNVEDLLDGYDENQYSNYNRYYYNNPYVLNENLDIHLHAKAVDDRNVGVDLGHHVGDMLVDDTRMPTSIMCVVKSPLDFDLSSIGSTGIPNTALQVQPLTRYLLNYYITSVADLMTVIPLTENPWKTIYFPRALMAIGELAALGQTSTAKNALLNALLAVAAFNLQSKFPKNSDSMKYYLNLGVRLRNQASVFVKQLLNPGIEHCVSNEKYKDVLCAVMSMISVDLVWGTMQDTNFYIKWCGKVINTKMTKKKKLSSKAKVLHRIFLSLKLIQDSTCLDYDNIKHDFDNETYDVNGDKFDETRKGKIDFIVASSNKSTTPTFINKKLINTNKYDENFATDALYGLPNSLILLFSSTVSLLKSKIYYQNNHELPPNFNQKIDLLQQNLENWQLDWQLFDENDDGLKFYSPMHEATYHHIQSFYHALWIYFNRFILETDAKLVQTRVSKTLDHLNSIQNLIARGVASIIPLFWQGFIAGCEATSIELQMGFKKWGADIAQYLGSYWGARQIMLEVWRRKRMNEDHDDWVSVIHDWEMNLMLD